MKAAYTQTHHTRIHISKQVDVYSSTDAQTAFTWFTVLLQSVHISHILRSSQCSRARAQSNTPTELHRVHGWASLRDKKILSWAEGASRA